MKIDNTSFSNQLGFWINKKVLVTGGCGFIGSHLVERLLAEGARVRVVDDAKRGLVDNLDAVADDIEISIADLRVIEQARKASRGMDVVMHCAAVIRGVGYNVDHHGEMFYSNAQMNLNMLEAARLEHVERFLCVSTVGVYPKDCTIPTPEGDGFKGEPEYSGYGYGWAKRLAEVHARCYQIEYGMKVAIVRPYNVYGPRDDFNASTAPVIPSQIRKVLEAKDKIIVWGDGEATRSFTYVTDEVDGMMLAVEKHPNAEPLNIASEEEIKVKDLVKLIMERSGRQLFIEHDLSKPTGAPRRCADISRAKELLGFVPKVSLDVGIGNTVEWYRANQHRWARVSRHCLDI